MSGALAYAYAEDYAEKREKYELIDGKVFMMARPTVDHWQASNNIIRCFERYLTGKRCRALGEIDVYLNDKEHVIPDAMIVCNPDIIKKKRIEGVPDLIVEVLSPSNEIIDRTLKLRIYEQHGVKEYWLVDPMRKSVTVYLLRDGTYVLDKIYNVYDEEDWKYMDDEERAEAESQRTIKVSLYEDFTVEVADIFRDVN